MRIDLVGRGKSIMEDQTQMFLEYANEAATKIRKTHEVLSGGEPIPECGSLLGDTYYLIADMIQSYLLTTGMKIIKEDEFNNMTTMIMFVEKDGINNVIEEYRNVAYV